MPLPPVIPSNYQMVFPEPAFFKVTLTITDQTFFVQPGSVYRVRNLGSVNTVVSYGSGPTLENVPAGSILDTSFGNNGSFKMKASSGTTQVAIQTLFDGTEIAFRRSLLNYVLKATDAQERRLVGTFYGRNGRELLSSAGGFVLTLNPTTTVNTLGTLYLTRPGAAANGADKLWADAYEFRGMLLGGPVLVIPSSPASTTAPPTPPYDPPIGTEVIRPGFVILGGQSRIWQMADSPGITLPAPRPESIPTIPVNGQQAIAVDNSSSPVGVLAFRWDVTAGTTGLVKVVAKRRMTAIETSSTILTPTTWFSEISDVDESFVTTGGATKTVHVELPQGMFDVTISATGLAANNMQWMLQRIQ